MPQFSYYLPEGNLQSSLDKHGLGYAFECTPARRGVSRGPDGRAGVVVSADVSALRDPDNQQWRKIGGVWVGRAKESRIGPGDLARREQLRGHPVLLGDGNEWMIPVARGFSGDGDNIGWYVALPEYRGVNEDGEWVTKGVDARYQGLWDVACRVSEVFASQGEQAEGTAVEFDATAETDAALLALQVNYRVGKIEVDELRLFTSDSVTKILMALIDIPTLHAILAKKKREQS